MQYYARSFGQLQYDLGGGKVGDFMSRWSEH